MRIAVSHGFCLLFIFIHYPIKSNRFVLQKLFRHVSCVVHRGKERLFHPRRIERDSQIKSHLMVGCPFILFGKCKVRRGKPLRGKLPAMHGRKKAHPILLTDRRAFEAASPDGKCIRPIATISMVSARIVRGFTVLFRISFAARQRAVTPSPFTKPTGRKQIPFPSAAAKERRRVSTSSVSFSLYFMPASGKLSKWYAVQRLRKPLWGEPRSAAPHPRPSICAIRRFRSSRSVSRRLCTVVP